jgi:flagellar motor switch protein FliN/FliY
MADGDAHVPPEDIAQAALDAAAGAVKHLGDLASGAKPGVQPLPLPDFGPGATGAAPRAIDLLSDVNLNVKIELGRTRMLVEDVLKLSEGAVVELDKLAGDPVDVYVNDRHVARGEVLVLNDNFCVRINEILSSSLEAPAVKSGAASGKAA